jgi:hypothetical protein
MKWQFPLMTMCGREDLVMNIRNHCGNSASFIVHDRGMVFYGEKRGFRITTANALDILGYDVLDASKIYL